MTCAEALSLQAASIAASTLSGLPTVCRAVMSSAKDLTGYIEHVPVATPEVIRTERARFGRGYEGRGVWLNPLAHALE